MIYFLIVLYALLMGTAAFIKRRNLSLTLTATNLLGSVALLCTPYHPLFLLLGLIMLLCCALRNGYALQGRIRPLHVAVRSGISIALFICYIL